MGQLWLLRKRIDYSYRQGFYFGTVGKLEQTRPLSQLLHNNFPFNVFPNVHSILCSPIKSCVCEKKCSLETRQVSLP